MSPQLQKLHENFCRDKIIDGYTPRTIKWYRNSFKYFCKSTKIKKIQDITECKLKFFFFEGITEKAWKETTSISYYKAIKNFLDWCTKEGFFEKNPIEKVKKRKEKKQHIPDYFSDQNIRNIFAAISSKYQNDRFLFVRNYAIISTLVHSGIRKNELLVLKEENIDFERRILSIKASKWNKDREVPIPENTATALKRYAVKRLQKNSSSEYFFISHFRTAITESYLRHFFRDLSNLVGFKVSSHRFRHTYATGLRRRGVDLKTIARLLGHSSIQATLIYSHVTDDDLIETIDSKLPIFL